ncbi:hypothetical protein [Roseiconus lacunae]|uniref:Peptidase M41 domain-containing protein n=1 Tax=Roseiconus lacunae TaxID=2605694 RepID=A0ABT7PNZ5_9BACT|nr:hypothetical protein [Roseiconus lacunae]MDM4018223.1 hypothetical protein [Roseiconus lacunae]
MQTCTNTIAHHEAAHAVIMYRVAGFTGGQIAILHNDERGRLGIALHGVSDSENTEHLKAVVLSCYAGGIAQRKCDPKEGTNGCEIDDQVARKCLGWLRELNLEPYYRDQAAVLVEKHWSEISTVAEQLRNRKILDETEVETISDAVSGDPELWGLLERFRLAKK